MKNMGQEKQVAERNQLYVFPHVWFCIGDDNDITQFSREDRSRFVLKILSRENIERADGTKKKWLHESKLHELVLNSQEFWKEIARFGSECRQSARSSVPWYT